MQQLNPKDAFAVIDTAVTLDLPLMLWEQPGVGKSSLGL
jgi:MoxR-like ATPase